LFIDKYIDKAVQWHSWYNNNYYKIDTSYQLR
jgi:hypothetical protein